jgi:hypothetical protein
MVWTDRINWILNIKGISDFYKGKISYCFFERYINPSGRHKSGEAYSVVHPNKGNM